MNFFIGNETTLTGFTQVAPRLFVDRGWKNAGNIWYKGYSTECTISERLNDIVDGYKPAGKWCVIQDEKIFHPVLRGFPLYHYNDNITTLKLPKYEPCLYETPNLPSNIDDELTIEEASYLIGNILVENVQNFYRYNNPTNVTLFISAGLDTQTCWAVQDQVTTNYTARANILSGFGFDPAYENDVINSLANQCWGYRQIVIDEGESWTTSGFYAEVYTYRDIAAATCYANYLGKTKLDDLVTENDYYYGFITRPKLVKIYNEFKNKIDVPSIYKLKTHLWDSIWYDHQMWHLDQNMFFCPFADLRIPEIAIRLNVQDLIRCGVNGDIQRHIINRFAPERVPLISKYKNTGDVWHNFKKHFRPSMISQDTKFIAN